MSHPQLAQMLGLIKLMRPKHWIKNGFVLAPLLFSGAFLDVGAISEALLAALLFCLASSATYIINDMFDIEHDRRHPQKSKTRPLAAGVVSLRSAVCLLVGLYAVLAWGWLVAPKPMFVVTVYLILIFAYTLILKQQPVDHAR